MTKSTYRISLSQAFLLLACFSVGLVANIGPTTQLLGENFLDTFTRFLGLVQGLTFTMGAVAILPMLWKQASAMKQLLRGSDDSIANCHFSLYFALVWRIAVSVVLAICLSVDVLASQQAFSLPQTYFFAASVGWYPLVYTKYVCIIVALGACLDQFRAPAPIRARSVGRVILEWLSSVVLALLVLPRGLMILLLVYLALHGVEAAQPAAYHRPGASPNFHTEGYWLFWLALAEVLSLAVATALWTMTVARHNQSKAIKYSVRAIALIAFSFPALFSCWYFMEGLPVISPDFSAGGLESRWWHWAEAAILLAFLIPAGTYRVISTTATVVGLNIAEHLAESTSFLMTTMTKLLALSGAMGFILFPIDLLRLGETYSEYVDILGYCLTDVEGYLPLAVYLLSFQLLWKLRRSGKQPVRLRAIEAKSFFATCLVLAILIVVGIPTIAAYSFCFWLGPLF